MNAENCGSIDDFGRYEDYFEEGGVENREEFQALWERYYPDSLTWYKLTTITYKNTSSVFCGDKLIFQIHSEPQHHYVVDNLKLAVWLTDSVDNTVQSLEEGTYNSMIIYLIESVSVKSLGTITGVSFPRKRKHT